MNKNLNILQQTDASPCLSAREIQAYCNHSADAHTQRRVETHTADCMLCSDAIDGYREAKNPDTLLQTANALHRKMAAQIATTPTHSGFRKTILSSPARMAAAAAVLLVLFSTVYYLFGIMHNPNLTAQSMAEEVRPEETTMQKELPTIQIDTQITPSISNTKTRQLTRSEFFSKKEETQETKKEVRRQNRSENVIETTNNKNNDKSNTAITVNDIMKDEVANTPVLSENRTIIQSESGIANTDDTMDALSSVSESEADLDEVVVIGYGQEKKSARRKEELQDATTTFDVARLMPPIDRKNTKKDSTQSHNSTRLAAAIALYQQAKYDSASLQQQAIDTTATSLATESATLLRALIISRQDTTAALKLLTQQKNSLKYRKAEAEKIIESLKH